MTTIDFTIQTSTERISGNAILVDTLYEGKEKATAFFAEFSDKEFKSNKLGKFESYTIYENYTDSGSEDYFFFAVLN